VDLTGANLDRIPRLSPLSRPPDLFFTPLLEPDLLASAVTCTVTEREQILKYCFLIVCVCLFEMSYLKHFVLQHQNYEKLFDYSLRNNMVVYQRVDGLNRNADEPVLSECCRLLLLRLIRMVIDFFDSNLWFDAFTFNDIMIDLAYDNVPRLVTGLTTNTATPGGIDRNLSSLVDVIEKVSQGIIFPADWELKIQSNK